MPNRPKLSSSARLRVASVLLMVGGGLIGFAWFVLSLVDGGTLPMNGPWLVAILSVMLGGGLAFASISAAERERVGLDTPCSFRWSPADSGYLCSSHGGFSFGGWEPCSIVKAANVRR